MNWNTQQLQIHEQEIYCFSCGQPQEILHPALQGAVNKIARREKAEKWLQVRCNRSLSLSATVPSVQESSITDFRHAPDFDLLLFTFGKDQPPNEALYTKFSYCRMLLRPGGTLVLVLPETGSPSWFSRFSGIGRSHNLCKEAGALRRTGYVLVAEKQVHGYGRIVYGKRPEPFI